MYKVHEQVLGHNEFSISVNYNNSNFFFSSKWRTAGKEIL